MQTTAASPSVPPKNIAAEERAKKLRSRAHGLLIQADSIEAKGNSYIEQPPEEKLKRLNSWSSYMRRVRGDASNMAAWHSSNRYLEALELYRILVRQCRRKPKRISYQFFEEKLGKGERQVRTLLKLLEGKSVTLIEGPPKNRRKRVLPGFPPNEFGHDLVSVRNGGPLANIYEVARPPQFRTVLDAQQAGLLR